MGTPDLSPVLVVQSCPTVCHPMDCSLLGFSLMEFSRKNTGVGCHFLFQGTFPTHGLNTGLLCCRHSVVWATGEACPLPKAVLTKSRGV